MCVYCACRSVILKLTRTCICACACIVRVDLLFYSLHAHENFWDTLYHYFPLIGRNFLHARACACDFVTKKSMLEIFSHKFIISEFNVTDMYLAWSILELSSSWSGSRSETKVTLSSQVKNNFPLRGIDLEQTLKLVLHPPPPTPTHPP